MKHDDELLLIDMDEIRSGHPIYEIAGICKVYAVYLYEKDNSEIIAYLADEVRKNVLPYAAEIGETAAYM